MPRPDILSRRGVLIGGALGLLGVPTRSFAQPDMQRLAPPTIADRGSALYRFLTIPVASQDGARSYRLIVAVPRRMAPQSGYPIAWLLDGKAAMGHVDEPLLASLDAAGPPVIVAIGHDTPLRLDGQSGPRHWLGLQNFYVITRYNHSAMYAMAIWELSQALVTERLDEY